MDGDRSDPGFPDGVTGSLDGPLARHERAAADEAPQGLLVLLHGRGSDRHDLVPLLDLLDPAHRLHAVTLEAPLQLAGSPGWHWYVVERVGFPDPGTFRPVYERLCRDVDELAEQLDIGHDRVVLGGFSQGCVMATSVAVGPRRPRCAALLGWSGFTPRVDGWNVDRTAANGLPVALGHGTLDMVIRDSFAHDSIERLRDAGADVTLDEASVGHEIVPAAIARARQLVATVVPAG